ELPSGHMAAKRIDYLNYTPEKLFSVIKEHCIDNNEPLVVSNMNKHINWNTQAFSLEKLKREHGEECDYIQTLQRNYKLDSRDQHVKSISKSNNINSHEATSAVPTQATISTCINPTTIESKLATPKDNNNKIKKAREYKILGTKIDKMYAKDIECPQEYTQAIQDVIPEYLLPLGNNDLFSLLPQLFQAKNFMCYLGQDQTGTPIHRDLCGTMGHNIMTMGSPGAYAEWLIVVNKDREKLASVLELSKTERKKINRYKPDKRLDQGKSVTKSSFLESDRAWLSAFKVNKSDFPVQVIIQKPGDLVIVPSRAYHQVRNVGVSIKLAWNRITAQTLEYAFEDQLPLYRIINRPEVYKCKAIVSFTINEWYNQLLTIKNNPTKELDQLPALRYGRESFIKDSKILLNIFLKEIIEPDWLPEDPNITTDKEGEVCIIKCDFCHTDIFHRYYHCEDCDGYDICMYCYSIGRSCRHVNGMVMRQGYRKLTESLELYKGFVELVNSIFNEEVVIDGSDCLNSESPSLATLCSRIESYRKAKGNGLNTFKCLHCKKNFTAANLAAKGVSLTSIFKRPICPAASVRPGLPEDVFICKNCSLSCKSCIPLEETNESMEDYDLVYYSPASFDARSWGTFFDFNVNKTCDYPEVTLVPATPSHKRKSEKTEERPKPARTLSSTLSSPTSSTATASRKRKANKVEEPERESFLVVTTKKSKLAPASLNTHHE
ncbi:hypothetical protein INT48_009233, partial [Thamnidium elegans]